MKLLLLLLLAATAAFAGDKPLLNTPGKVIAQPDLKSPLGPEWSVAKGKWEPKDGVLSAVEIPEEKHAAVLHLATGNVGIVWECEFRLNDAKVFYVGCDSASHHVGRIVITPKNARLCDDSTEVKGVTPSRTLAETGLTLKPDEWQKLRVEMTGDKLAARLNGAEMKVEDPNLATPRVRWWFAAGGGKAEIRNVKVSEGVAAAEAAK